MNFPDRFSTFPRLTLAELPKKTVFQKTYEISGLKGLTEVGQTAVRISPEPMVREVSVRFEPSSFHVIDQKVDPVNLEGEKR